ncbi:hypothetical protein C1645_862497 [Glomus cerebriforme]|uniref:Uncharacterized protein n=1 Tax=Glomus cerebriforme TaxID=658196 RepID=A0A397SJ08_9GLOM|nr:hypothetical protein C1645_862497 [Glomus cerebriforme]
MDNINFASANSISDNLDPYVLFSTKEEMDTRKGNFSIVIKNKKKEFPKVFFIDLEDYQKNGAEKQSCKGNLRAISSAIQEQQSNFPQYRLFITNDCECEQSYDLYRNPRGCSLLLKTGEISFLASRTTLLMNNYDGESKQTSNSNQRFLKSRPGENYKHCIWCVSFSSQKDKGRSSFILTKHRPIPFSSERWSYNFNYSKVGIRELCGDECLDFLMPVQNRSSNQDLNNIDSDKRSNVTMRELRSLSELVDAVRNNCKFHEFDESQLKYKWIIDEENKEYFSDAYGITNINPLLVDNYGMNILFLDSRGILFEWCEFTKDMYVLGINKMEGLANLLYHPEKRLKIMEDTGEMIPDVELKQQAKEIVKAQLANLKKA